MSPLLGCNRLSLRVRITCPTTWIWIRIRKRFIAGLVKKYKSKKITTKVKKQKYRTEKSDEIINI